MLVSPPLFHPTKNKYITKGSAITSGFKRTYAENRPRPGTVLYSLRINLKRFNNVIKSLFNIDDKNKISCKNINSGLFKPLFMAYTLQTKLK